MDIRKQDDFDEKFLKVLTECAFCDGNLLEGLESVKQTKLLECLHSICENCLKKWESEESCCPKCLLQVHKNKLLDHKILEELVDPEDDPATLSCSMHDTQLATHWCQECADYICERCIENHQQLKVTKDHVIVSKMEHWERRDKRQGTFPCSVHPSEQLVIFCTKCNIMTCRDCQLASHREHSYEFVDKVIDQAKTDIYDMFKFLNHHKLVLEQAQACIVDRKQKLMLRKHSLIKEINIFSAALIEIINKRSQSLIGRLEQMTTNKVEIFDSNSNAIGKIMQSFDHTIQFVSNVLNSSSDPSIIFTKDQILSHMKRIHYQKSNIPNVVRHLQMKFTSGDITNLMKELQSFGLISLNDDDEDGEENAIEMAAINLCKALRMALAKQFAASSGVQHQQFHQQQLQQLQQHHQHLQQIQQIQLQQKQQSLLHQQKQPQTQHHQQLQQKQPPTQHHQQLQQKQQQPPQHHQQLQQKQQQPQHHHQLQQKQQQQQPQHHQQLQQKQQQQPQHHQQLQLQQSQHHPQLQQQQSQHHQQLQQQQQQQSHHQQLQQQQQSHHQQMQQQQQSQHHQQLQQQQQPPSQLQQIQPPSMQPLSQEGKVPPVVQQAPIPVTIGAPARMQSQENRSYQWIQMQKAVGYTKGSMPQQFQPSLPAVQSQQPQMGVAPRPPLPPPYPSICMANSSNQRPKVPSWHTPEPIQAKPNAPLSNVVGINKIRIPLQPEATTPVDTVCKAQQALTLEDIIDLDADSNLYR